TDAIVHTATASRLASGPNAPPLSHAGPEVVADTSEPATSLPEVTVPKIATIETFHPKCSPIDSHSDPVATYAAPSIRPASMAIASTPQSVAPGLRRWMSPNRADDTT